MKKRVFITGAQGFVGTHMSAQLSQRVNSERYLLTVPGSPYDLRDYDQLVGVLKSLNPDWVVHLAAISSVKVSIDAPRATYETNFIGTLNLLEALKALDFKGRLLFVSSADAYGVVEDSKLPISEDVPLSPRNPYAVSKAAAELLCKQYVYTSDLDVVICRPFNHIGPGQALDFAISNFAHQISEIERNAVDPIIRVGDIETTRDFLDVRDVVSSYIALLEFGIRGEVYNVCSGIERSVSSVLESLVKRSDANIEILKDAGRYRNAEQRRVVGSNEKIRAQTGWSPAIDFRHTLLSILDFHRNNSL